MTVTLPTHKNITTTLLVLFVFSIMPPLITQASPQKATLRNYQFGDKLPAFKLPLIDGNVPTEFTPGGGKPTLMIFFSIRPNFRKKRSLTLLSSLSELADRHKQAIKIIGIYSDNQDREIVTKYINSSAKHVTVYYDPSKMILDNYGVFMMPMVVMTTKTGKLHEVIPYTYNIRQLIEGNINLLLGKWTRNELNESLRPKKVAHKSEKEKTYIRRINYGRIMKEKKMHIQAIREFTTAIKIMPEAIVGYLELGFAEIATKAWEEAEKAFKKALTIDKDSDEAIAGLGLTYYGRGDKKAAREALENAFIAPHPKLEVIIALAAIYEAEGNNNKANRLNKLAVSRLMTMYEQRWK